MGHRVGCFKSNHLISSSRRFWRLRTTGIEARVDILRPVVVCLCFDLGDRREDCEYQTIFDDLQDCDILARQLLSQVGVARCRTLRS